MKKLISALFVTVLLVGGLFVLDTNETSAASLRQTYGASKLLTVPASYRGTWVSKSGHGVYRKIKLTKHTITMSNLNNKYKSIGNKKYIGTWTLYDENDKHALRSKYSDRAQRANKYAEKHHWMYSRVDNSHQLFFKFDWTNDNENSFILLKKGKNTVRFSNTVAEYNLYRK